MPHRVAELHPARRQEERQEHRRGNDDASVGADFLVSEEGTNVSPDERGTASAKFAPPTNMKTITIHSIAGLW